MGKRLTGFDYSRPYFYMVMMKCCKGIAALSEIVAPGRCQMNAITRAFVNCIRHFHEGCKAIAAIECFSIMPDHIHLLIRILNDPKSATLRAGEVFIPLRLEAIVEMLMQALDAVRRILATSETCEVGRRFLIQHSAGSGKSNTITWLAYQLVLLHNAAGAAKFDSIIVVTDRINLDHQIRDNINAFVRLQNIVGWADRSGTLKELLQGGKKIIISTIHKFSFILDEIGGSLKSRNFAIIIDEAHSSQTGAMSSNLAMSLSGNAAPAEDGGEEDVEDVIHRLIKGRKLAKNANYYAFTATPKNKTLEMFGEKIEVPEAGVGFAPFHEYTMKRAIEEKFILDVVRNYTPYTSYYKVVKAVEDDPEFDKDRSQKKIRAYVERQPSTIEAKAKIIVDHFCRKVYSKIGGKARAMVVTSSIERAKESLPREKIKAAGSAAVLTGAELLATLLKTGAEGCDVLELSRRLIDAFGSIEALVKSDLNSLKSGIDSYNETHPDRRLLGLGEVKIFELAAVFELARRGYATKKPAAKRVLTSKTAARTFRSVMTNMEEIERFWVLPLDARKRPLAEPQVVAQGTLNGVDVHPRDVFRLATRWNAHSIVVAHNHPSGNTAPGKRDVELTWGLYGAGRMIGIPLVDHIILAKRGYYSFADEGRLEK